MLAGGAGVSGGYIRKFRLTKNVVRDNTDYFNTQIPKPYHLI